MHRIILLNKMDLETQLDSASLAPYLSEEDVLSISVTSSEGIDQLEQGIKDTFFTNSGKEKDATYISNSRHIALLEQANMALDEVLNGIELGMPVDLLQIDMTRSWDLLGEIIGDSIQDELITQLFSQFCLGK